MSELHAAGVDQAGLMQVLAHHLYSTAEVSLRELVQNAHDSCTRRTLEHGDFEAGIHVIAESGPRVLRIRDNGAGLTREEIVKYLATIGGGYTRALRQAHEDERLIGAFGLGFLSAYVVAERVEVFTTSVSSPDLTHRFHSRDGLRFTIDEVESRDVGTEVVLHLKSKFIELSRPTHVAELLNRYTRLLSVPIYSPTQVNAVEPSWRGGDRVASERETASWFEPGEVLACFPLVPDGVVAGGVLWVHNQRSWGTTDHRGITVFVRGMLVAEDATDLLPAWAGFVGAAVECNGLTPTASRETLQKDVVYSALKRSLHQSLVAGLRTVAAEQPTTWKRILRLHNEALVGAALSDQDLFDLMQDVLLLPTSEGDLTLPAIVKRANGRVPVAMGGDGGAEALLYRVQGTPVVDGIRFGAQSFAQVWCERHGNPLEVLGSAEEGRRRFVKQSMASDVEARMTDLFDREDMALVVARYEPATVPLVWVPNREVQLRRRLEHESFEKRVGAGLLAMVRGVSDQLEQGHATTLYLNANNPLIQAMLTEPHPADAQVAALLMSVSDMTLRNADIGVDVDLATSMQTLVESLETLRASVAVSEL